MVYPFRKPYDEFPLPRNWQGAAVRTTMELTQVLIASHLTMFDQLTNQRLLPSHEQALMQGLRSAVFDEFLDDALRLIQKMETKTYTDLRSNTLWFRNFWNRFLEPVYADMTAKFLYQGGAPELVLFRKVKAGYLRGDTIHIGLPWAAYWDVAQATASAGDEDVLMEIHLAASYPQVFCSFPNHLRQGGFPDSGGHDGSLIAPSECRVLRTFARNIQGKEVHHLVVRPVRVIEPEDFFPVTQDEPIA